MTRIFGRFPSKALIWTGILWLSCGDAGAQTTSNPLIGAWSGTTADGTSGTDVYTPDGTLVSTVRSSVGSGGVLIRAFARYSARQVGPNQIQVDTQLMGYLPHQVCSVGPNGNLCQPFPQPNLPTSMTVTFLDQNTIQANGIVSHRDDSPVLSQMQVPETAVLQVQNTGPGPAPEPGVPDSCTPGSTVCLPAGWRAYCERWPDGHAGYMQHGVRCRNGYNQPEF